MKYIITLLIAILWTLAGSWLFAHSAKRWKATGKEPGCAYLPYAIIYGPWIWYGLVYVTLKQIREAYAKANNIRRG
jgi:hypothetical protein